MTKKTNLYKFLVYTLLFTLNSSLVTAQVVFEQIESNVYTFLDREAIKGIIDIDNESVPFSRKYISGKLIELEEQIAKLSNVEKEELNWYKKEFSFEIDKIKKVLKNKSAQYFILPNNSSKERIRLYSYEDERFQLKVSPIAGYGVVSRYGEDGYYRKIGVRTFFTVDNWFGGSFHFSDNGEFGENIDKTKWLTRKRGHDFVGATNGQEFSELRCQINANWSWGTISLRKDYMKWGSGYFGNVYVSDKAPSYPHLYLEMKPTKWLRFYYAFGWPHSGVIDSNRTYVSYPNSDNPHQYETFIKKYFAINMLTIQATKWLNFSLGNSFIYAGDMRAEMFIPFNFFKYMDRDTGKKSIEDGNGALFFDTNIILPFKTKLYASLFVDVTSIKAIIGTDENATWDGWTAGIKRIDFIIPNLDITIEYTRINPFVYEHKYETTTYKHLNYSLGYWSGHNSDNLKLQLNYQPIRGLSISTYFESLRKGGNLAELNEYGNDGITTPFLAGSNRKDSYFGISASYEIIHELFIKGNYRYSDITDEDKTRTEEFMLGKHSSYNLTFSYGI